MSAFPLITYRFVHTPRSRCGPAGTERSRSVGSGSNCCFLALLNYCCVDRLCSMGGMGQRELAESTLRVHLNLGT